MKTEDFDKLLEKRIQKIKYVLASKAKEYATEDRLHNFKRAGEMLKCHPAKALQGFLAKHLVSINDLIDGINNDEISFLDVWDEKIGDAINYLILLEAIIRESPTGLK